MRRSVTFAISCDVNAFLFSSKIKKAYTNNLTVILMLNVIICRDNYAILFEKKKSIEEKSCAKKYQVMN